MIRILRSEAYTWIFFMLEVLLPINLYSLATMGKKSGKNRPNGRLGGLVNHNCQIRNFRKIIFIQLQKYKYLQFTAHFRSQKIE
mgnify:CR=1 FL=1